MVVAVLLLPVVAGLLSGIIPWRRGIGWLGTAAASGVLVTGVMLATDVVHGRAATALGGVLRADALSAFMVIVIGVIATLATWQGVRYLDAEIGAGRLHAASRRSVLRSRPGLCGHDAPGRVGRQPGRPVGGHRSDNRRHHLPGRTSPRRGRRSKRRGNTS